MSRQVRAEAQSQKAMKQLQTHAFNITGWAFKHPNHFDETIVINAYKPKSTPYEKAISKFLKEEINPWRSSIQATHGELEESEYAGVLKFVVVGWAPRDLEQKHKRKHPDLKKQSSTGVEVPDGVLTWNEDKLPLIVVAQIFIQEREGIKLWALLNPNNSLCTPCTIAQKDVFYLPQFRDNTTDLKSHGPSWNKLASKACARQSDEEGLLKKQKKFKRARDTSKVVIEPQQSLVNEIFCLVSSFSETKEEWHLKELISVLEEADKDLAFIPLAENQALRKFIDNTESFTIADAQQMEEEFAEQWASVQNLNVHAIMQLKEGLQKSACLLGYRFLRAFVVEGYF